MAQTSVWTVSCNARIMFLSLLNTLCVWLDLSNTSILDNDVVESARPARASTCHLAPWHFSLAYLALLLATWQSYTATYDITYPRAPCSYISFPYALNA